MVTTTYPAGQRPRIRVRAEHGGLNPLPNLVLTKINSKSAYFRSSHVVGEMAVEASLVEIIRHADGTPVLESEHWPPLTPYDTGARMQPQVWVLPDRRRPEEFDADRYGKVDFEDDAGTTIATVHGERVDGTYVLVVYSAETNSEIRINLSADLDEMQKRITGEVSQPGTKPVVLMRNGETFEGDDVDVIDITTLLSVEPARSEWTKEEALGTAGRLRAAGYESAAEEIEEWWA
jgi:hypothetical protein